MSKLDLEWLQVFDEVFHTRSVSRAADHLGIAQATASIALNKLRAHFGDKLFTRTPAGMQPTSYASEIRPVLKQVLELLQQARSANAAFDPGAATRTFRICMTDIRQLVMLPRLVAHLAEAAPRVRLEADLISEDSARAMADGGVELAIGHMPQLDAGFRQRTLMDEDFVCLVARGHPRIGRRLSLKAALAERQVLVDMHGTGPSIVEQTLARMKLKPEAGLRVSSFLPVGRMVAQSELIVFVPRGLGESLAEREDVRVLASPIAFPAYAVRLYWHERFHADPGNAWLRQVVADLFRPERRRAAQAA